MIFFHSGVRTTSAMFYFTLNLLVNYPEVQRKLQIEVDSVIGRSRLPHLNDKDSMPYIQAVLLEAHRYLSLVPLSIPHVAICDTTIGPYDIPKGTTVIFAIYSSTNRAFTLNTFGTAI